MIHLKLQLKHNSIFLQFFVARLFNPNGDGKIYADKEETMQVSEIMHKGITAVNINDSVKKVAELMKREDIGAVPVLEGERPVGIVTDRDIFINCVAGDYDLNGSIDHAMTGDVVCVTEDQDVAEASKLMAERKISRILVVDKSQKPVGIVSLQDLSQESEDLTAETVSHIKQ